MSGACVNDALKNDSDAPAQPQRRAPQDRRKTPPVPPRAFADIPAPSVPAAVAAPELKPNSVLDDAFHCADQGHLVEAAALCETFLQDNGPSAQAYYLLGLVRDAAGNKAQAEEYLRKALYLDPNHYEALVQLAVLAEQQSDLHGAQQFRQRAQRVRDRLKKPDGGGA